VNESFSGLTSGAIFLMLASLPVIRIGAYFLFALMPSFLNSFSNLSNLFSEPSISWESSD